MTFLARGDVALSVAITSASTLLAPVMTPILTLVVGRILCGGHPRSAFSVHHQNRHSADCVWAPGHRLLGARVALLTRSLPLISVIAITLIVAFVIGANEDAIRSTSWPVVAAVIAHNLAGWRLVISPRLCSACRRQSVRRCASKLACKIPALPSPSQPCTSARLPRFQVPCSVSGTISPVRCSRPTGPGGRNEAMITGRSKRKADAGSRPRV